MLKLYSTNCPVCKSIKKILTDKKIDFEEVTDIDEIENVANLHNIENVPFAITSNGDILNTSVEIINFINL